ncbi:hypothetical protein ACFQT0_04750 [Hymenobacter humi]|uniref:HEAT repeat domain-containing protein n=1 Tax=Hymenobacter humi TaxID=1411620 RepID=A0ABW2U2V7_9BACT
MQLTLKRPGFLLMWLLAFGLLLAASARAMGGTLPPAAAKAIRRKLETRLPDTTRLRLLDTMCGALKSEEPARALPYGEAAVALARTLPQEEQGPALLHSLLNLSSLLRQPLERGGGPRPAHRSPGPGPPARQPRRPGACLHGAG